MSIVLRRSLEAARTQRLLEFSDQSDTSLNETSMVGQLSEILLDDDRRFVWCINSTYGKWNDRVDLEFGILVLSTW